MDDLGMTPRAPMLFETMLTFPTLVTHVILIRSLPSFASRFCLVVQPSVAWLLLATATLVDPNSCHVGELLFSKLTLPFLLVGP